MNNCAMSMIVKEINGKSVGTTVYSHFELMCARMCLDEHQKAYESKKMNEWICSRGTRERSTIST